MCVHPKLELQVRPARETALHVNCRDVMLCVRETSVKMPNGHFLFPGVSGGADGQRHGVLGLEDVLYPGLHLIHDVTELRVEVSQGGQGGGL